jgi:hypothetical protein
MSTNQRFILNEKCHVTDILNPANSVHAHYNDDGAPEDDRHLRECVLRKRLSDLLDMLIINLRPMAKLPDAQEYQTFNEECSAIEWAVFHVIKASHLNSFDPALSIQHKFGGTLKREKKGMEDFTSLSLFRDEVECLLRDLYGDIESEALDSVLYAVFSIVKAFTKYARADLCKEHDDAVNLDYMLGIGVPEGYGINGSDWRCGMRAKFDLMVRAYDVHANPSDFSKYTVEFANRFGEHWIVPNNDKELLEIKTRWFTDPEELECEIPF